MKLAALAGTVYTASQRIYNNVERDHGPQIRQLVTILNFLNTQDVTRQFHNSDGNRQQILTNLGSLIAPLISSFGFLNSNNSRSPASQRDIDSMQETKITEDEYEYNEESKEMEAPKCSICIFEIMGPAIKTECRHFFHKDCLSGWLRIHNHCPVCREQVIR